MDLLRQLLQVQDCCGFVVLKGAEIVYHSVILCVTPFHTALLSVIVQQNLTKREAATVARMPAIHREMYSLQF